MDTCAPPRSGLVDRYGRRFPYLRLSITDACNFRCTYCLPNGYTAPKGQAGPLDIHEIKNLLSAFGGLGLQKVRLTGGEPSLRRDLPEVLRCASRTPGVRKVALTTNGYVLRKQLSAWVDAGLTALNVSVDSLCPTTFAAVTGHDRLADVLAGVDCALEMGLAAVKLNAVLLRGVNDGGLAPWLTYARSRRVGVRFIELMQTGTNSDYFKRYHVRAERSEGELLSAGWQLIPRLADGGPAREYAHPDYAGTIGFITPYSKDFCAGCNRLRVTARGDLRLCLFGDFGTPLRPFLQSEDQLEMLRNFIAKQLGLKGESHRLLEGNPGITPHLASIGG